MNKLWRSFTSLDRLIPQVLKDGTGKSDIYCSRRLMSRINISQLSRLLISKIWPVCTVELTRSGAEAMEANIQLVRIIQEMQAKMNKLEKENQALRIKLTPGSQKTSCSVGESGDEKEACEQSLLSLHTTVFTDTTPAVREPQGEVMIVRRYSTSSSAHSFAGSDPWKTRDHSGTKAANKYQYDGVLEAEEIVQSSMCSSIKKEDNEEKILGEDSGCRNGSSQRASPEDGSSCRDKIKTVSFLLPMAMSSHSKHSSSLKYSPNQTTDQLRIIAE